MRAELSPTEREALLRDMWVAHDGRWFLAVAAEFGFDAANKLNQAAVRSIAKKEAKEFKIRSGAEIANASDFKEFLDSAGALYWPDEHKREIEIVEDNLVVGHVLHCYVWDNISKAGGLSVNRCAAPTRFRGWLEGLGLSGEVVGTGECDTCNGSCDISFRFDRPLDAVRGQDK
jgi:DNA-binding transcriptional regulator/RsmH inhibitor MraZ